MSEQIFNKKFLKSRPSKPKSMFLGFKIKNQEEVLELKTNNFQCIHVHLLMGTTYGKKMVNLKRDHV